MKTIAFADGACLGNPGPGGYGVILCSSAGEVKEFGGREESTTNNRMELTAALEALRHTKEKKIEIRTDSKYLIQGMTEWLPKWKLNGWKSTTGDVKNKDLWETLEHCIEARKLVVSWTHVAGHAGIPGNERVDEIASGFAAGTPLRLYEGLRSNYSVDLDALKAEAPYYLSVIEGQIHRDKTWGACEARIKGKKGVKFKKVSSAQGELSQLRLWGISSPTKS